MKIYTRLVMDWDGNVLEAQSYEHTGSVAWCKGGGDNEIEPTAEKEALARISEQMWSRHQDVFVLLENKLMDRVRVTEPEREQAAGLTGTAMAKRFDAAGEDLEASMTGLSPASGAYQSGRGNFALSRATASAMGQVDTQEALTDLQYQGLEGLIAMGRGKRAGSFQGLSQIASRANERAIGDAVTAYQERQGYGRALGFAAGFGADQYLNRGKGLENLRQSGDGRSIMSKDYMGGFD